MSSAPDQRMTGHGGESRNGHFADGAANATGFNVQAWIDDADPIDEARGWRPGKDGSEDPDLDFYDD